MAGACTGLAGGGTVTWACRSCSAAADSRLRRAAIAATRNCSIWPSEMLSFSWAMIASGRIVRPTICRKRATVYMACTVTSAMQRRQAGGGQSSRRLQYDDGTMNQDADENVLTSTTPMPATQFAAD